MNWRQCCSRLLFVVLSPLFPSIRLSLWLVCYSAERVCAIGSFESAKEAKSLFAEEEQAVTNVPINIHAHFVC